MYEKSKSNDLTEVNSRKNRLNEGKTLKKGSKEVNFADPDFPRKKILFRRQLGHLKRRLISVAFCLHKKKKKTRRDVCLWPLPSFASTSFTASNGGSWLEKVLDVAFVFTLQLLPAVAKALC